MKNSADQGGCYPQRPKTEVDNTLRDLQNSSYHTKAEFNNYFVIHSNYFPCSPSIIGFLGQLFNNLQRAVLLTSFWRHWFDNLQQAALLTSLVQYDKDSFQIGQQQLVMVNYAYGFNQSETWKYFEWIVIETPGKCSFKFIFPASRAAFSHRASVITNLWHRTWKWRRYGVENWKRESWKPLKNHLITAKTSSHDEQIVKLIVSSSSFCSS